LLVLLPQLSPDTRAEHALFWCITFIPSEQYELTLKNETEPTTGEFVLRNFLSVLGIRPHLGRMLDLSDDLAASQAVAVLS